MPTFLGIDCGGSSTRTCLIDADGNVLHRGQSGPGNLASTPQLEIERNIRAALENAPLPDYVAGCFAGLLTDADRQRAISLIDHVVEGSKIATYPDFHASLAAQPDTDIIVIAGTGALIASKTQNGVIKSAGGGPLLGDFGSAFDLGRRALSKTILAAQPAEASPMFWDTVTDLFGSDDPNQVLAAVYRSVSPAARVAKLAPVIVIDALRGLKYARQSVDQALHCLAEATWQHISAHHSDCKNNEISPLPIGEGLREEIPENPQTLILRLAGGMWEIDNGALVPEFKIQFESLTPRNQQRPVAVEKLSAEPVIGATNLAKELSNHQN